MVDLWLWEDASHILWEDGSFMEIGTTPTGGLLQVLIQLILAGTQTETVGAAVRSIVFPGPKLPHAGTYSDIITSGTGIGQASTLVSIVGSATSSLLFDLQNLTMSGLDDPVSLIDIKSALVQETSPSGSNYLLMGDSTGTLTGAWGVPWSEPTQERIGSGGAYVGCNPQGWTISASQSILQIAPSSGTVHFQIDIVGTSA